ncbi:MAG: exosortase C-terminal domain/associated protein EpsI [Paraglaciecola sp.]|uniref:exosortase C-terminal domain/associated protein EpsI n=1 Tax=Paraglaciecola sp. TaxID=1920173 RepID=UPI0032994294
MKKAHKKLGISLSILMLLLSSQFIVTELVVPEKEWFEYIGEPNYAELMPEHFGDWERLSDDYERVTVSPEIEQRVNELYSESVTRIYRNKETQNVIMVSLAYGSDQMFPNQVHRPDACYPAQGFKITSKTFDTLPFQNAEIPISKLVAKRQFRNENVMYWIRLGNGLANATMDLHYNRIYLAAYGYRADGLLFRVSHISNDTLTSYEIQSKFVSDFLGSLNNDDRKYFIGGFWK